MPSGARKRKASKKKNKKGEAYDSNNHHSQGSAEDPKSLEERDSDGGELEREEEEEEVIDRQEVDTAKGEGLEEEVVHVVAEEKALENSSGGTDFSAVDVGEENRIVVPASVVGNFDGEDKEVAVVEEDEKSVIAERGELKAENPLDGEAVVDCVEEEAAVEINESDKAQIIHGDEKDDLVKEAVKLAPEVVVSAGTESLVMPVLAEVIDSELTKIVDSSFSQTSDDKDELTSAMEAEKSEPIENPAKVVSINDEDKSLVAPAANNGVVDLAKPSEADDEVKSLDAPCIETDDEVKSLDAPAASNGVVDVAKPLETDDEVKSLDAPAASNGVVDVAKPLETDNEVMSLDAPAASIGVVDVAKPLETGNLGAAGFINTSREVDNGKEMEIQKPSEDQPLIGSNPLPIRRTSLMGCCGLFEVFAGAKR